MCAVIPVIDLLAGHVVRAVRGERGTYRPIESALCRSADALQVAPTLCEYTGSPWLYAADLDALLGREPQIELLRSLLACLPPEVTLWLDAGFRDQADANATLAALGGAAARVRPVFGSETLQALGRCFAGHAAGVLSLDRRQQPLDAAGCWQQPDLWPRDVIVMTLDSVGAGLGPDLGTFVQVRERAAPGTRLFGAGGLRHEADLHAARAAGATGWLVASALHDKTLPRLA